MSVIPDKKEQLQKVISLTKRAAEQMLASGQREIPSPKSSLRGKRVGATMVAPTETISKHAIQPHVTPTVATDNAPDKELKRLEAEVMNCKKCALSKTRIKPVFGAGNSKAKIMFVGEGPGYEEDRKGEPFIGRAGQLLTREMENVGLFRKSVYITNIVKCHPLRDPAHPEARGNDRPPTPQELSACIPYLWKQIELINPEIICTLGAPAARALTNVKRSISQIRGQVVRVFLAGRQRNVFISFHPAYLLRNPQELGKFTEDMAKLADLVRERR
jgi:DNA polymerase